MCSLALYKVLGSVLVPTTTTTTKQNQTKKSKSFKMKSTLPPPRKTRKKKLPSKKKILEKLLSLCPCLHQLNKESVCNKPNTFITHIYTATVEYKNIIQVLSWMVLYWNWEGFHEKYHTGVPPWVQNKI